MSATKCGEFMVEADIIEDPQAREELCPRLTVSRPSQREDEPRWTLSVADLDSHLSIVVWCGNEAEPRLIKSVYVGPVPYDGPMGVPPPHKGD